MSETFEAQYASMLKDIFREHARQQLTQGAQGMHMARTYAEQGKPDFALAFLLEIDGADEEKRDVLARAYERRAHNSDEKALQLATQFHRSFPLIRLEAQRDRAAAQTIRDGQPLTPANTPPIG